MVVLLERGSTKTLGFILWGHDYVLWISNKKEITGLSVSHVMYNMLPSGADERSEKSPKRNAHTPMRSRMGFH